MRLILLLITALIVGVIAVMQFRVIQNYISPQSPTNPTNVNQQLHQTQEQVDKYNQTIQDFQTKTDDTLKSLNR